MHSQVTADRVVLFKYMVRSLAERAGLRATFMPKPFASLTGSGCHAHVSLHEPGTGKNLCKGGAPEAHLGLTSASPSAISRRFIGYASAVPRLHLGCISAIPRRYLAYISPPRDARAITAGALLHRRPARPRAGAHGAHQPDRQLVQGKPRATSGNLGPSRAHLGPSRPISVPSQATNPTLGSSKRLGARMTSSGATWCTDSRD